ncbi:hypothetical protein NDU88_009609 [Pleurodeles waltl]|uniref:Uncharacterized protein n=1 Tax=Pleurodeles waltl TaxID=8319 RepID=A0AAV7QWA0_PLEWA|nr:hypothetical protein NDU88_009609 [Pleurodeles waltl]
MQKQAAPAEAPEQAFRRSEHGSRLSTTKEGPTKSEVNSASWAMQDGVLGTWAVLCTKEVLQKCTEALAAAVHAVHRITVWRGEKGLTFTKFGQKGHWTVGDTWIQLLCSRDHAHQDERGPRGLVMQNFWCLRWQGEDSVDPQEISSWLPVQGEGRQPSEHAPPGNSRESWQDEALQCCW